MSTAHNVDVYDYNEVWTSIKNYHDKTVQVQEKKSSIFKVKRTVYLEYWGPRLKQLKEDTAYKFNLVYTKCKSGTQPSRAA